LSTEALARHGAIASRVGIARPARGAQILAAVRQAVDAGPAAACREPIWQSMTRRGLRRQDPATWPPLVRIDDLGPAGQGGRVNVRSRARGLLALFLLTDVALTTRPRGWYAART
jgi:hypothetical protein